MRPSPHGHRRPALLDNDDHADVLAYAAARHTALRRRHQRSGGYGGLSGVGIIAGGLLISALPLARSKITAVLLSFAVSCATVALTALAPSGMLWLATVWWFIGGLTFSTGNAPMMALLQTIVPNRLQGRALSLLNTLIGSAGPLGLALAGLLGGVLSVRGLFIAGGTLSAAVCLLSFASRHLRRIETPA